MLTVQNGTIVYHLNERDINLARDLAKASSEKYARRVSGTKRAPYLQNNLRTHVVGKIGEVACGILFKELQNSLPVNINVELVYLDSNRDAECDLIVNGLRLEIKTWRPSDWYKYGACIAEKQAPKLSQKADIVLYGVYDVEKQTYELKGFNTIEDVESVVPEYTGPEGKQVLNRILKVRPVCTMDLFTKAELSA